jgi:hypothetical protein
MLEPGLPDKRGDAMVLSTKLIRLIEGNAKELTRKWLDAVRQRPDLPTYRNFDEGQACARAFEVYSQLGKWLSQETAKSDVARIYTALGRQRRKEGFALSEVVQALIITRRILWFKVQADGFLDNVLDLKSALDLNNSVVLFFDRAIHFTVKGFEEG